MTFFSHHSFLCAAAVLFSPCALHAQLCTGSLGDPVLNINFDHVSPAPLPYIPAASNYTYQSASCPNDGFYTMTKSSYSCYNGTWHDVPADHSGHGQFLLINAPIEPADFFVTTVGSLCPNATYQFSAWILNMVIPGGEIKPDIGFSVEQPDGTILANYDAGDIPVTAAPEWHQYGLLFTAPANGTVVVLRIRSNAHGGSGNDFAVDDISLRPCGPQVTAAIPGFSDTVDVCVGDTTQYPFSGMVSPGYLSPVYQWQESMDSGRTWQDIAGATSTAYLRLPAIQSGSYSYRLAVVDAAQAGISGCWIGSNSLMIGVHPLPVVNAGPDRTYLKNFPITLSASATGEGISYAWSPDLYIVGDSSLNPVVSPPADMDYTLTVLSAFDCMNKDSMHVRVVNGISVPDAFTPNDDGINDRWHIPNLDPGLGADVEVFNRWGGLVYQVSGAEVSWDGKMHNIPQPAGTYVYVIRFKDKSLPGLRGVLMLIR